jgi:hypothetical protein
MIVAAADAELFVAPVANELADRARLPKVEGSAGNAAALADRDQCRIDRCVTVGEQPEPMTEHVAFAGEVEE